MSLVDVQFLGCGDAFGTGGRFNTCFHVKGSKNSFLIDCGASSMVAMKKFNVAPNSIDTIFLTHLHGDHFAGVIFFLMDARYLAARTKPLVIAGPKGVKKRIIDTMNVLYPGCWDKGVDFEVLFVELTKGRRQVLNGVGVHPYSAKHLQDGNDFILRFDVDDKVITYSGDTGWTEELLPAAKNADLFICESFHYDKKCEFHLDFDTIKEKREELNAKHTVLTHLGPTAFELQNKITHQVAFDGMKISV
ncbi:MBL fold metallo-hydrolase [Terasakiella sp. A23]|uniref:MBL fold metallo-hydrolase n=1 Tax=Terasakiella sp. FCG-A23 TaxID=3080561 RepID=UPI0029537F02|nr:MBL fold metallo-hydrolase [Terasakiella sp. A23]MDV7340773.1 MBL fold metallo-hydrolase [Terasakiella sp. A23]